jgi:8-oxo-dGTP pyrophosphatase MutT (NUDIX family)
VSAADPMESVPGDAAPVRPDITPAAAGPADGALGGPPRWLRDLAAVAREATVPARLRPPPGGGRPSAVLVLFGMGQDGPDLLLVQRGPGLRRHSGQPAFPGGAIDESDAGPVPAALREAAEEAGVEASGVEVLAVLPDLFIARSGFAVTPVLAWWRRPVPVAAADPPEVTAVARVPLSELCDPRRRLTIRHPSGVTGPAFRVRGMLVWGFTAALVDRLLTLGGWERPWDHGRVEELPPEALAAGS